MSAAQRTILFNTDLTAFNNENNNNTGTSANVLDHADCVAWGLPGNGAYPGPAALSNDPGYMYMGGTSMATPDVAGAALLVREYLNTTRGDENPTAALVKAILLNGAVNMPNYGPAPNHIQGWGRLDLESSLTPQHRNTTLVYKEDESSGTLNSDTKSVTYSRLNHSPEAE